MGVANIDGVCAFPCLLNQTVRSRSKQLQNYADEAGTSVRLKGQLSLPQWPLQPLTLLQPVRGLACNFAENCVCQGSSAILR